MSRRSYYHGGPRTHRAQPRTAARSRRGVILLVVLGLLALFTVVVLTFVILARQHQTAAIARNKAKQYDNAYEEHLKQAALQVLRGTTNAQSVLGPHSLLEDLYGSSIEAQIAAGGFAPNDDTYAMGLNGQGRMVYIRLDPSQMKNVPGGVFEQLPHYYSGRIITMTSGAAKGKSARITGYAPIPGQMGADGVWGTNNANPPHANGDDDGNGTANDVTEQGWPGSDDPWQLRIMPFEGMTQAAGGGWTGATPAVGDSFIINGRTFAGTGFGYDPRTFTAMQLLNATDLGPDGEPGVATVDDDSNGTVDDLSEINWPGSDDGELSLLPNPTSQAYQNYLRFGPDQAPGVRNVDDDGNGTTDDVSETNWPGSDDGLIFANEDYDAVDYQNMLLALRIAGSSGTNSVPIPSLHRPELINFWANRPIGSTPKPWNDPAIDTATGLSKATTLRRKVMLRPLPSDHFFTENSTSNPGGTTGYEFREPFFDANGNGTIEAGEFTDLDGDGAWDAGDFDFTGKTFNPIEGPWDVDNDGDGQPDSIWVDIGLPVETMPDGRQYRPLVAIMCLDMDGKLNLNFNGQLNDWNNEQEGGNPPYANPWRQMGPLNVPNVPASLPELAGTWDSSAATPITRPAVLVPGLGLGPQEVSLSITHDPSIDVLLGRDEFRNLCRGFVSQRVRFEGRYGEAYLLPENVGTGTNYNTGHAPVLAGRTKSALFPNGDDNYFSAAIGGNNTNYNDMGTYQVYGSPTDFDGNGVLGLGPNGQPRFYYMGTGNGNANHPEVEDDAAELSAGTDRLASTTSGLIKVDAKFTPADLEWLLRQKDIDGAALQSRLSSLAPSLANRYSASRATTESWSIPSPSFNPTPEIARGLAELRALDGSIPTVNLGITDLIRGKIKEVEQLEGNTGLTVAQANARTRQLIRQDAIAPELLLGLRFNINRPFGNNIDDDGDGIVDEPDEGDRPALRGDSTDNDGDSMNDEFDEGSEPLWSRQGFVDRDGDGRITSRDGNGLLAIERQRFARQLFTLMMLLKDYKYLIDNDAGMEDTTDPARAELTAREIAQWCINVVDFRDQDSIMTPFEYVINPFDAKGWNIDGDISTNETDTTQFPTTDPQYNANRRVVWGNETPTLLLTETLAFHDRRVEDLDNDDGAMDTAPTDPHYDSKRMPQGSAFLEVQCVRNPNNTHFSQDLFTATGELDLDRMAPGGDPSPVWRVAISEEKSKDNNANDVTARMQNYPFSSTLETTPDKFNHIVSADNQDEDVRIERIVWFAPQKPSGGHPELERVYYNRAPAGSNVHLQPGHYAVVGPSRTYTTNPSSGFTNVTRVGTNDAAGATDSPQEIRLSPTFEITDNNSGASPASASYPYPVAQPTASATIKTVMSIAVGGDRTDYDASWNATTMGPIGLSISEPLFSDTYYPVPDEQSPPDPFDGNVQWDRYAVPKDVPLDSLFLEGDRPNGLRTGTDMAYKTAFLQRLADPTRPHDPVTNPYRTVDWLPMDLTVFNSIPSATGNPDQQDPTPAAIHFGARQRGDVPASGPSIYNLWSATSDDPAATTPDAGSDVPFKHLLVHTLGFLNEPFHHATATPPWLDETNPYLNPTSHLGDPHRPFPWLNWNNRPFANAMELMQVPISSSGRLLWDYSNFDTVAGAFYSDPVNMQKTGSPFGHLLNFFLSANQSADYATTKPADNAVENHAVAMSNYFRLFDFVHVPSPFVDTETLLDPTTFSAGDPAVAGLEKSFTDLNGNGSWNAGEPWEFAPFYAPNNRLPNYREPGKININTISDGAENTWLGITNSFNSIYRSGTDDDNAHWGNFLLSRQGYAGALMQPSATLPSIFANPFRMTGNISHVPIPALRGVNTSGELVDSTLLRRLPNSTGHVDPLFSYVTEKSGNPPVYNTPDSEGEFNDSDRNPYFRYQSLQKLGNTLTTQSNVYAVWITVGFFEVERVDASTVHPDGYRLGPEIGSDTGEIQRHRSFMIVDRSIPVGFQRGMNHNVHKAILLKRIIE